MYGDVDDVRDADNSRQLNADVEKDCRSGAEMAEVRSIGDDDDAAGSPSAGDGAGCDSASKWTAAPLSSRASAFSIAALMKDCETEITHAPSSRGHRQTDNDRRLATAGSLYGTAADQWQQLDTEYCDSEETVKANIHAEYWTTLGNTSQRRKYICTSTCRNK